MIDIVILSNAKTPELYEITKQCLDSLMHCNLNAKVFVLEQTQTNYFYGESVETLLIKEKFNYNKFANIGARLGTSEYICIANNDLIFDTHWFDEILKAKHPVCSPRCPVDKRQKDVFQNEVGDVVGRHLSGWCFVIKRTVWEAIGGFDEDFSFWCADNSLMEQLLAIGIQPMLVRDSVVEHLGSRTLNTMDNRKHLTHDQVKKFNRKYNKNLFGWGI